GAALAWNSGSLDGKALTNVLNRDVFEDSAGKAAGIGLKLGFAHQKLGVKALNETPLGTVIAAPKPEDRELFCRNGLKWHAKITTKKIMAALNEIEKQRKALATARPESDSGKILVHELDLAARMAAQSCKFMLWQQAIASKKTSQANRLARQGIRELRKLEQDFEAYWPLRNKATTRHCSPFLKWRIADYSRGK
ncbi:MAG: hypothetical protein JF609_07930, partial [Verrucomicrobia bacterium]|nr:hypothetical protein [Verrucomicrobiota bacterium]